jgi:AcrR family transcriptional regulator
MSKRTEPTKANGDNRERLLHLAADLFAKAGYASISVRDLASRLGLSTGAVYSNFRSKGDLLAEVLDLRIRADMERERPDVGLPDFVRQSFLRMRDRAVMRALLVEAATAARTDIDLRQRLYPTLCGLLERWISDYRDWQQIRHVDRQVDMDALVRSLWSIELGLGVLDAQGALRVKPAQIASFIGAFLDSLETSDGPRGKAGHRPIPSAPGPSSTDRSSSDHAPGRLTPVAALRDSPKAAATQARLMEAALELFATRGYSSVTVRDLARATSMTTGSIYGNFANKAVLLVEVIEARIGEDLEQLPESLVVTGSPAEFVEYNLTPFDERAQLRALLLEGAAASRADPDVKSRLRALQRGHLNRWAYGLDEWVDRNDITSTVDSMTAVTVVWSAELGQGLLEAFDLGTTAAADLANTFGAMFRVAGFDTPDKAARSSASRRRTAP